MKLTLRNLYLPSLLLLVTIVLMSCNEKKEPTSKNQEQKQYDELSLSNDSKEETIVDNKIDKEVNAKLKSVKQVPIVKIPVDPEPWPYPEPYPEPYPFPFPEPLPEPNLKYEQEEILDFAEVAPEFPGGIEALLKFIQANINYPQMEKEQGVQGKVYIRFAVMKNGEISYIKIMRGIKDGPNLDKEAIRIVKLMPNWTPGMNKSQKVNVYVTLPIRFSLE